MKKILILISFILMSFNSFSQNIEYPKYTKDGDTTGVIFTISQAQKIDNDEELITLYKQIIANNDSVDIQYIKVVDNLNKQIAVLNFRASNLESISSTQDSMINNLKLQIADYQSDQILSAKQSSDKDTIISNDKKEISKLKLQKIVAIGTTVAAIIGCLFLLIH